LAEPSIHLTPIENLEENHPFPQWTKLLIDAGEMNGMSFDVSTKLEGWVRAAGFVCVEVKKITVPVGGKTPLGKKIGLRMFWEALNFSETHLAEVLGVCYSDAC
jgi:hypothetical protein